MSERGPGIPSPSPEERKRIEVAQQEADPTTFSELPLTDPEHVGYVDSETHPYPIVEEGGSRFVELIGKQDEPTQQVVAHLLKGIINVSDVVRSDDGRLYSKDMPLDRVAEEMSDADVKADIRVLGILFGDYDHALDAPGKGRIEHNVKYEPGKAALYDFEMAKYMVPGERPGSLRIVGNMHELKRMDDKLVQVSERISGPEGHRFVEAIFTHADTTVDEAFPPFVFDVAKGSVDDVQRFIDALHGKIEKGRAQIKEQIALIENMQERARKAA